MIIAAVGLIVCFLPWWSVPGVDFFGQRIGGTSINGLHKLGIASFIFFIAAGVVPLVLGDKTKPFEGQEKMITTVCFGASALFTLITLLANSHYLSFGIFIALIAAIVGALFVWGIVKMPESKPPAQPTSSTPPQS